MGRYAVATLLLILLVLQAPHFSLFPCSNCRRITFEKPTPTPSPPPSRPSPPSPHPSPKPHPSPLPKPCPPPKPHPSPPCPPPKPHPSPPRPSPKPHPSPPCPPPKPHPPPPCPPPKPHPSPPRPSPKPHPPSPSPAPAPSPPKKCPINVLKLGLCVDILDGLVHVGIGKKAKEACCPVIKWMMGMDAAVCLCMAIRLKLMDVNLLLPITLQLLADCGKRLPSSYKCPCMGEDCS